MQHVSIGDSVTRESDVRRFDADVWLARSVIQHHDDLPHRRTLYLVEREGKRDLYLVCQDPLLAPTDRHLLVPESHRNLLASDEQVYSVGRLDLDLCSWEGRRCLPQHSVPVHIVIPCE